MLAANYPFATIEPNVGHGAAAGHRLRGWPEIFGSERILPATVTFVDIAGIVKGASEGEGMGNAFLPTSARPMRSARSFVPSPMTTSSTSTAG